MADEPAAEPLAAVSAWLKPRGRWLQWPVIILAIVAAFGLGRLGGPERVEERWSVVETTRKVIVQQRASARATYTKTTKLPDGTLTIERSTKAEVKTDTRTEENRAVADVRSRIETSRPDWRVGVLLGGGVQLAPTLQLRPAVGLQGERRIIGPFSAGLWGIVEIPTAGALQPGFLGGLSVSGEF